MRIAHTFSLLLLLLIGTSSLPLQAQDGCWWSLTNQAEESGEVEIDETDIGDASDDESDLDPILLPIIAAAMPPVDSVPYGSNENWQGSYGLAGTEGVVRATATSGNDLYAGGEFRSVSGKEVNGIARWDGTRWNIMGDAGGFGVDGIVYAIAVDGDDVYVGGEFRRAGNVAARNIAVWNRTTNTWRPLGKGIGGLFGSAVLALAVNDGVVYAGGRFVVAGTAVSVNIAQWNGTGWKRVGTGINRTVRTLGVDDGYLYAGGDFTIVGDQPIGKLARFDIAARSWGHVNADDLDPDETVAALAFDEEYVYVGGRFDIISGVLVNNVARYRKSSGAWSGMLEGVQNVRKTRGGAMILDGDGIGPIVVHALAIRGDDLFVGGDFDNVVSQPMDMSPTGRQEDVARDMAKWNRRTEVWSKMPRRSAVTGTTYNTTGVVKGSRLVGTGADFDGQTPRDDQTTRVYAFAAGDGDALFIGGSFDFAGPFSEIADFAVDPNMITLDPEAAFSANICRLGSNDTVWSSLGGAGFDHDVEAMADDGRYIYAGGRFFRAADKPVSYIARLDKQTGLWEDLSGGMTGASPTATSVHAIEIDGNDIYAGGLFRSAGGVQTGGVARWNATTRIWVALGTERFDSVYDIDHDGTILAAVGDHGLAIWDGAAWEIVPNGPDGMIYAVEIIDDKIYVGGTFAQAGGAPAANVAMWDRTGRTWSPLANGVVGRVNDMEVWSDKLYIAGDFNRAGSFQLNDIAAWSLTSPGWLRVGSTLRSSVNGAPTSIATLHVGRYGLYIGGQFQYIAEGPVTNRANGIMLFDGEAFRTLGNGVAKLQGPGSVHAIASDAERLHVGGSFHYAGVKPANRFGQWVFPIKDTSSRQDPVDDVPHSTIAELTRPWRTSSGTYDAVDRKPLEPFDIKDYHPSSAAAAHPDDIYWDGRFAPDSSVRGADDEVFTMASDDTVVFVGGAFTRISGVDAQAIVMWNGSDWETLDDGIAEGIDGFVYALAIDGDDVYVGGQFVQVGGTAARNIAVWNRTTRTWRALGEGMRGDGSSTPFVAAIVLHEGKVYAGGTFASAGGVSAQSVAVWDGTSWSALGEGIDGSVSALEELDGRIYAGGSFGTAGTVSTNGIAYWDGGTWERMGDGVDGSVNDIAAYDDPVNGPSLLIGGSFTNAAGSNLIAWIPEESAFQLFDSQTTALDEVRDISVSGEFVFVGGSYSFTPNFDLESQKFSQGLITNVSFNYREDGWTPWITMEGGTDGPVNALITYGNQVIAGGAFSRAGEAEVANIAQYSRRGRVWQPMISGTTLGTISALTLNRGQVYAAGMFRPQEDPTQTLETSNVLASLGTTGWHVIDGTIRGNAYTAGTSGDDIIVGGTFITTDDIIGVNATTWNAGTKVWRALTPGSGVASQEDFSYVTAITATPLDVYLGGRFNVVDTFETPNVAALDRRTGVWRALGDGLDGHVWALLLAPDGSLYAGGDFKRSGSVDLNGVARWDGTAWHPLGEGATNGVKGSVRSLAWGEGRLYVGGIFKDVGGLRTDNIAMWNPDAAEWTTLGPGLGTEFLPSVDALVYTHGTLFAGGFFENAGDQPMRNIARWNGQSWETLGSGVDHAVYAMLEHDDDIYVAGSFLTAGEKPSAYIAQWHDPTLSIDQSDISAGSSLLSSPNPFADATMIDYTVPQRGPVRIVVHDLRGVEIARLVDGMVDAGTYRISWSPSRDLPAGVYVCRMECAGRIVTGRIVRW